MSYTNGLDKPSDYFNTVLYTGTGSELSISSLDFSPDWVWVKQRSADASHFLYDSVRGATKSIRSNSTNAEATVSESLKSFDSNGFTLGTSAEPNTSSGTYVGWSWRGSDSSASSNTDGSITSTVSANQTAGFSIGTYNGTSADNTVGHGLGVAPDMIIVKCKSTAHDWVVYHSALGNAKILILNATTAAQNANGWQYTSPTSTVFSIDNAANSLNQSGQSFVFYAFASKKGYSKFGSYTGNGSTDGTFVYLGFKPAFVIIKSTDLVKNWLTFDNLRLGYNGTGTNKQLHPNTSGTETSGNGTTLDILSNGFKTRTTDSDENGYGQNYIYMAFAEEPLVANVGASIPATAR